MKKLVIFVLVMTLGLANILAQSDGRYTILYLIPFESDSYTSPYVKECEDMEAVRSYQLMGFWNGAQMALDEYNAKGVSLNIIVRDISNNESKLCHLMENEALMRDVDLIVGPFFGKLFTIAAHYAKQYQIPIVNPFSSRQDFIEENEYVFTYMPHYAK